MHPPQNLLGLALGLALVAGCGPSLVVNTDWNPALEGQILRWQTFTWLDHTDGEVPYEGLEDTRIRSAIGQNLSAKGYRFAPGQEEADFLVAHHLSVERHFSVHSPPYYGGWYGGYGRWATMYDPWYGMPYIREWETGVLVVDLVDAATFQVAWQGVAESQPLGRADTPEQRQAILQEAIDEMLQGFPAAPQVQQRPLTRR